jgi:hypothetical protein
VGADGLIKYAGVNEARFDHDPETGESLGLLIEEGRSNLIEYSEDISNSNWINSTNITSNTSDTTSPNGLNTATKLFDTTLESSQLSQYRTIGSYSENNTYTFSIFVKPAERDKIRIALQNVSTGANFIRAHINLSTETVENSGAFGSATFSSASIIKYPNNWYRIFITGILGTTSTTVRINAFVQFPPSFPSLGSGGARTGDGTSGIYIWGAQLEEGSFPTSYIPTVASTRTRAADSAKIEGKEYQSCINDKEGTIKLEIIPRFDSSITGSSFPFRFKGDGGGGDNIRYIRQNNSNIFDTASQTAFPAGPSNYFGIGESILYSNNTLIVGYSESKNTYIGKANDNNIVQRYNLAPVSTKELFIQGRIYVFKRITFYPQLISNQQFIALTE